MNYYVTESSAVFFKTRERFGELSNMASGFPLQWEGRTVYSSEALYQALKFPRDSQAFKHVINEKDPFLSKKISRLYKCRPDWDDIKLDVMDYCIRLKYLQHQDILDQVLDDTEDRAIVEKSNRDTTWGAINDYRGNLVGFNMLGQLWTILREERPAINLSDLPD